MVMVALVFGTGGCRHLKSPRQRAGSIGIRVGFIIFLRAAELAGAPALAFGVLTQWAAVGLIVLMRSTIYLKVVKWKTGFWGENASGWHYGLLFIVLNPTILCTRGRLHRVIPYPAKLN
jgi:putative oxidoreductase